MCVVSMIGDHYSQKTWPYWADPNFTRHEPNQYVATIGPTKAEFDQLKKEVEEMKELLKKAVDYDRRTGQPDCQNDEKIVLLRKIAEIVGVDLNEVFK